MTTPADDFMAWIDSSQLDTGVDADGLAWSFTRQFPAFIDTQDPAQRFCVIQPDESGRQTQQVRQLSFVVWLIGGINETDPQGFYGKACELSDYASADWCSGSIASISSLHAPMYSGITTDGRLVYRLDFECIANAAYR